MTRHAIVVLGMHRSGTSAVTRMIGLLGAEPPRDPMPPTADNPVGYWESRRIARFNNRLLESAGTRWHDDRAIAATWFADPAREADRVEARSILAEEFATADVIVLKDPRICRLLPFWRTVLAEAGIAPLAVVVLRDPLEVARSLAAREADPSFRPASVPALSRGLALWLRYVLDAERHSHDMPRVVIDYAEVLRDWRRTVQSLCRAGPLRPPDAAAAAAIDAFLDPTLRRQHGGPSTGAGQSVPPGLETLRSLARAILRGGSDSAAACAAVTTAFDGASALHPHPGVSAPTTTHLDPRAEAILAALPAPAAVFPRHEAPRSITFLSGAPASIGHVYRVRNPVAALAAHGWRADWLPLDAPEAAARAMESDVVVVFRAPGGPDFDRVAAVCRDRDVPLVYDIDDLIFDPDLMRSGAFAYLDRVSDTERSRWLDIAAGCRDAIGRCAAAVVTTAPLAAAARRLCGRVHVLPNGLSAAMMDEARGVQGAPKPSAADGRPRIGFASGTPTHQRDFAVVAPALARLLAARTGPLLTIVGHLDLADYPELLAHPDRLERRPHVPLDRLHDEVARFDVNLAPLEVGNPFCEAKSPIRFMTAAAVGVPTVASPTVPLRDAIVAGRTGLLATDASEWETAITRLLDDPEARAAMGDAARTDVLERLGWARWSALADDLFTGILAAGSARARVTSPTPPEPS